MQRDTAIDKVWLGTSKPANVPQGAVPVFHQIFTERMRGHTGVRIITSADLAACPLM
jgi:hypothetical protein